MKPKRIASTVFLCRCYQTFHIDIDGKPEQCPRCKLTLDWSGV